MTRVNRTLCTNGQMGGTRVNFLSSVKFHQFDDEERIRPKECASRISFKAQTSLKQIPKAKDVTIYEIIPFIK